MNKLLLLILLSGVFAEAFYISLNGNEFSEGTENDPYNSMYSAFIQTSPNDTIFVIPGVYSGDFNEGIYCNQDEHHLTIIGTGNVEETIFEVTDTFFSFANLSNNY